MRFCSAPAYWWKNCLTTTNCAKCACRRCGRSPTGHCLVYAERLSQAVDSTADFLNSAQLPPFVRVTGNDGFRTKSLLTKRLHAQFVVVRQLWLRLNECNLAMPSINKSLPFIGHLYLLSFNFFSVRFRHVLMSFRKSGHVYTIHGAYIYVVLSRFILLELPCRTGDVPHNTETSSVWLQLWVPQPAWSQLAIDVSVPTHCTSSIQIRPLPRPYWFPITVPLYLKQRRKLSVTRRARHQLSDSNTIHLYIYYEIMHRVQKAQNRQQ